MTHLAEIPAESPNFKQQHALDAPGSSHGIPLLVKAFSPLPSTLSFQLPIDTDASFILHEIANRLSASPDIAKHIRLTRADGQSVLPSTSIGSLAVLTSITESCATLLHPLVLEVRMAFKGGKGGFGSMLRAQGGKMSSNRNGEENNDSCRDLNGRRLSTVKQARQLALYMSNQAEREKEVSEAQKRRYAKLEKMLERKPKGESDFVEAAQRLHEQGGSLEEGDEDEDEIARSEEQGEDSSSAAAAQKSRPPPNKGSSDADFKGKKRERIDDTEYIEQSREIVDNVRSAVASAMMKNKKKKAKVATGVGSSSSAKATAQTTAQAV